jgi:hypothetical protein
MAFNGSGAPLTNLNGSNISSGTVPTARLASGTANSSTFLRGDSTWATVAGGVTSLNGQTGAITNTDYQAIGSICFGYLANVAGPSPSESYALATYAPSSTFSASSIVHGYLVQSGGNKFTTNSFVTRSGIRGSSPSTLGTSFTQGGNPHTGTALTSGSWRALTTAYIVAYLYYDKSGALSSVGCSNALFVRYA